MVKSFMCAAGFAAICGMLMAGKAMSAYQAAQIASLSCEAFDLKRVGELTYVAKEDAWISARGKIFRISTCPMIREASAARRV
jgi:hypothetical protein